MGIPVRFICREDWKAARLNNTNVFPPFRQKQFANCSIEKPTAFYKYYNPEHLKKLIKSLHIIFFNVLFLPVLKHNAKGNC